MTHPKSKKKWEENLPKLPKFVAYFRKCCPALLKKRDWGVKFEDDEAHGVAEYWIVDPRTQVMEQYLLQEVRYSLHLKSDNGFVSSRATMGFEIPIQAIFDDSTNAEALQSILNKRK